MRPTIENPPRSGGFDFLIRGDPIQPDHTAKYAKYANENTVIRWTVFSGCRDLFFQGI